MLTNHLSSIYSNLKEAHSVFISDLHLSQYSFELNEAFLLFIEQLKKTNIKQLFILGDWFNAWIGDDCMAHADSEWLLNISNGLQHLNDLGITIFFCKGNRDFLLGHDFLSSFNGVLLPDTSVLCINSKNIRLEHGDLLCTDDKSYQKYRRIIQHPITISILNQLTTQQKISIANKLRKQSKENTKKKTYAIMDVNQQSVNQAINNVDYLIHGHTHKPNCHSVHNKQRLVLGDWRLNNNMVSAVIALLSDFGEPQLLEFTHQVTTQTHHDKQ